MSDKADPSKAEKKAEPAGEGEQKAAKGGGLMSKTPVLLGVAMVLEAVVLFAGFKFLGGGAKAASAEVSIAEGKEGAKGEAGKGDKGSSKDTKDDVEIKLLDFKAPNKQSGRMFIYNVVIYVTTKPKNQTTLEDVFKDRDALIKDRVRTIIAESDPEKLGGSEPGLETLRRQIKYQLDLIAGDGMIDDVLVPSCIPYPAGF